MRFLCGRSTSAMRAIARRCPCRWLWRGLVQRTRTTPCRRMTLQCLQMALIDARTFMSSCPVGDAAAGEVERRQLDRHLVTWHDPYVAHAHRTREVSNHAVAVIELYTAKCVRHRLRHGAADGNRIARPGSPPRCPPRARRDGALRCRHAAPPTSPP